MLNMVTPGLLYVAWLVSVGGSSIAVLTRLKYTPCLAWCLTLKEHQHNGKSFILKARTKWCPCITPSDVIGYKGGKQTASPATKVPISLQSLAIIKDVKPAGSLH